MRVLVTVHIWKVTRIYAFGLVRLEFCLPQPLYLGNTGGYDTRGCSAIRAAALLGLADTRTSSTGSACI